MKKSGKLGELLEPALHPTEVQLRQFTWIAPIGFGALGLLLWLLGKVGGGVALGLAGFGVLTMLLGLREPRRVRPIFTLLMLIALPIGMVLSTVALFLIYALLFVPFGLWFRLIGRDKLLRRIDRSADTYWRVRTRAREPASYVRLY